MASAEMWSEKYFGGNGSEWDNCVVDGPFANLTLRWLADGGFSDHCLTRIMNEEMLRSTSQSNIDKCMEITSYEDAYLCWKGGPHAGGHAAVGGIVSLTRHSPCAGSDTRRGC